MREKSSAEAGPIAGAAREGTLFARLMRWCIANARRQTHSGQLDAALDWMRWAALLFCDQRCGVLTSPPLEAALALLGRRLPVPPTPPKRTGTRRWLHVFTHWEAGGHSALALRWIDADPDREVHSIALAEAGHPLPQHVHDIVGTSQGQVYQPQAQAKASERAAWLRQLAWNNYNVVVLHLHQFDVVSTAAFAVSGGPPVVLVNGADHMFWTGVGVADLAVHIRPLAQQWSERYRGLPRGCLLPVPLPLPEAISDSQRAQARCQLGLPPDACILLTISSEWKFSTIAGTDFTHIAGQVLQACPTAHLVVVGPNPEGARWREAVHRSGGRMTVHAATPHLQPFHQAADVYLDSMPLGSLTALLEVAIQGVPCMLEPRSCPYPLYPEDGALAVVSRPADMDDYLRRLRALVADPEHRRREGELLAASIRSQHCGEGWQRCLAAVKAALPSQHQVWPVEPQESVPDSYVRFWHQYLGPLKSDDLLRHILNYPIYKEMQPRLDRSTWRRVVQACADLPPETAVGLLQPIISLMSQVRRTSLCVDRGQGYCETDRLSVPVVVGQFASLAKFDLSGYESIRAVRWLPQPDRCKVRLEAVWFRNQAGQDVPLDLGRIRNNGTLLSDGCYLFNTRNPEFVIPLDTRVKSLIIQARWWPPLSEREAELERALEQKRNEFQVRLSGQEMLVQELRHELAMKEEQLKAAEERRRGGLVSTMRSLSHFLRGRRAG
jgi:hypothetical protein